MYSRQKLYRDETYNNKSRKSEKNMPSFSSTLLDEIYRSTDGGGAEKTEDLKVRRQGGLRAWAAKNGNSKKGLEDKEEIESFRACLVEKWMEKEANEKKAVSKADKSLHDSDLLFFSSTSSSNSDSSGALSSSDTEFFGGASTTTTTPKKPNSSNKVSSCFSTRPKPVKTGGASMLFDDFPQRKKVEEDHDDLMIKSKSRALKIYANLKKVKQPISPGGRLTSFINSLFNNANGNNNNNNNNKSRNHKASSSSTTTTTTTCSSASSFSRSCLSKYSPKSREKMRSTSTTQRTVRFHPVSVIVDEDSRPCGQKSIYDDDDSYGRLPPLPSNPMAELKLSKMEKNKRGDDISVFRKIEDEDEDEDDDAMSDSSSDLFELDHLALFGNNRFCEELPVYETTHLDTNRAIASGLIR